MFLTVEAKLGHLRVTAKSSYDAFVLGINSGPPTSILKRPKDTSGIGGSPETLHAQPLAKLFVCKRLFPASGTYYII